MRLGVGFRREEAVEVYSGYREEFPDGRRWDEAAFWGGHTLLSLDRPEEGREVLSELRRRTPLSFYAVQAGAALVIVNLSPTPMDHQAAVLIRAKAGEIMSRVVEKVRGKMRR